ncbi:hypothetical protein KFK09_023424 [Dendrobium nobile]|uniref:Uncharacterized protein n=1 Tax=Dendrobium nobile TaxID=94219 RepID=A0A8T3AKN3_DENNO|nr:hypothetical protein KFK09_023424 [Dendrobium nobile]
MVFQTSVSFQQRSFRPGSPTNNSLSDPGLLPTMVLPTSVAYYGHSDLHHRTTVFLTPVSCRLRFSRPPSPIMVTPTSIKRQRSFRHRSPADYGPSDLYLLPTMALPTKQTCIC